MQLHTINRLALSVIIIATIKSVEAQYSLSEICQGTFKGLTTTTDPKLLLDSLRNRYSRCKKISGNLEIVYPPGRPDPIWSNASTWEFLNDIVEVTGYVIISRIPLRTLPLPSLRMIGGQYLFQPNSAKPDLCSLCLIANNQLVSFGFNNLTEISLGDVYLSGSPALTYSYTVNWNDLFGSNSHETGQSFRIIDPPKSNGTCHELCNSSSCFGPSLLECHYTTKLSCNTCSNRCLKQSPSSCCNQMCMGGCYNTSDNGCVACQRVRDEGRCVSECPKRFITDYRFRPMWNPKYKVECAGECLKTCPAHLVDEGGHCYAQCKPGNRELANGTCVTCLSEDKCPSYCEGNDVPKPIITSDVIDYMTSDSIKRFSNCTHVSGNININDVKWKNMTANELRILNSVEVVTGYVSIQMMELSLFTDYSFLGNLTTIHGRYLADGRVLSLFNKDSLTQLGLRNLKRLSFGNVVIRQSPCNALRVNWTRLFSTPDRQTYRIGTTSNAACGEPSYNCSSVCDPGAGCWGPSDTMCVACRNFQLEDTCVERCESPNSDQKYYVDPRFRTCRKCHFECAENCTGPNADQCVGKCRKYRKGSECVGDCGIGFWPAENGTCYACHDFCEKGCNGPNHYVSTKDKPGGCSDCFRTIFNRDGTKVCGSRVTQCETGYATDAKGADPAVSGVQCTQCEEGCYNCTDHARKCQVCESARVVRSSVPPNIPAAAIIDRLKDAGYWFDMSEDLNISWIGNLSEYLIAYRRALTKKPYALEDAPCGLLNTPDVYSPRGSFGCPVEAHGSYFMMRPKFNAACVLQKQGELSPAINVTIQDQSVVKWWTLNQPEFLACRQGDILCLQCATECRDGCVGPTENDCNNCTNARLYHNEDEREQGFTCVTKCPAETPWLWQVTEPHCSIHMPPDERRKVTIITVCVSVGVVLLVLAVVFTAVMLRRRAHDTMQTRKMEREIAGLGAPEEPLLETTAPPDMASLRLIKVTELKIGDMIGNGAFGTVYRGLWLPETEKVKIPVAVKELTENSARASAEFLEEVRVMATVTHPCCVRIIGLCMGEKPLLVTPLMRFGSLLDYLRDHESSLSSRTLLTWSMQIALGMTYLEDRCIVHRDLAARNVLVQNNKQVKITDFGLAKLVTDQSYQAAGGKLPIKWLAIECITERKFTHKSDVWAFGVTLWEMFTFGARPYATVNAFDMLALLQRGDRLEQPAICTIDVYTVMLKCWFHEPNSRPTFRELADTFARMSRDPGHYLHIESDKLARVPTTIEYGSAPDDAIMASLLDSCGDDSAGQTRQVVLADDYLCPVSSIDTTGYSEVNNSTQVLMSDLLRRSADDPSESLPADYYAARSPQSEPIPPDHAPPPPPETDDTDSSRYDALEAGKGRLARLKGSRLDSIDGRYAFDPVQFVSELERETERRRQNTEGAAAVQLRKHESPGAPKLASNVPKSVQPRVDSPKDVYLQPRATDKPQPEYMEMRSVPQSIDTHNGVQPASALNRQTAPVGGGDTKPKVPVKTNDRAKTNLDLFSSPSTSVKRPISEQSEAEDTYLVAPSQPRPVQEPQETYVNMIADVRGGQAKPWARSNSPGVAQNAEYFADGNATAPKASLEEEDDVEEANDSYVNMNSDVQQKLLRR